jgi:hypothetical protein
MTTVEITLPDQLAQDAQGHGSHVRDRRTSGYVS